MFRSRVRGALLLALVTLTLSACDSTTTTPSIPTPDPVDEPNFTGTLTVNGAAVQPFTVGIGTITVTVTGLEPGADSVVGIGLGTWNGTVCQQTLVNDNVGVGAGLIGQANSAAAVCVRIFDVGRLTGPVNFIVTIRHF